MNNSGCQVGEEKIEEPKENRVSSEELKNSIIESLQKQGFAIKDGQLTPPSTETKALLRELHNSAVEHKRLEAKRRMFRHEKTLIQRIAKGVELEVNKIEPRLVPVVRHSMDEWLFRYAALHWSIPVSSGYGRRLRFLVIDENNGKLIGIIGLGDPVYSLGDRDRWIGWDKEAHREKLHYVMDAFALGAVPPYSYLMGGKLVAMLCASDEVRTCFTEKYTGKQSLILGKELDPQLALLTTTSALGRSSIYNRLKFQGDLIFRRVGMTRGSGEFHFSNGLYSALSAFATENFTTTSKREEWGGGFRNKREVVQRSLSALGISREWRYHGVQREIYAIPLASNSQAFLRGEDEKPVFYNRTVKELSEHFKHRWMLPRSKWDNAYRDFDPQTWLLWPV